MDSPKKKKNNNSGFDRVTRQEGGRLGCANLPRPSIGIGEREERAAADEKKQLVDRILNSVEEDNEKFLQTLRSWADRYEHSAVEEDVHVGSRVLPILINATLNSIESVLGIFRLTPSKKRKIQIHDANGIFRPSREADYLKSVTPETQSLLRCDDEGKWKKQKKHVAFRLESRFLDDGTGLAHVTRSGYGDGLPRTFASKVFEKFKQSLERVNDLEENGFKILGVEKTERVLRLKTLLTVVGEGPNETILIRKPSIGRFDITGDTVSGLIASQQSFARSNISLECEGLSGQISLDHAVGRISGVALMSLYAISVNVNKYAVSSKLGIIALRLSLFISRRNARCNNSGLGMWLMLVKLVEMQRQQVK
ncbi:ABC transporter g family member 34 [Phtheirospermum japonicum]|uniref:RING-type E3 ubiquitin transferase n=1 Tax=Phtheirospermum japonicum TaxID=374723 RepID=A0A830CC20_9LAMI|nr:ABC transporter g family member 34 [Phtheirospermum japonicum]